MLTPASPGRRASAVAGGCVVAGGWVRVRVGAVLIGNPAQEWTTDEFDTLCVLRLAVKEGVKNGCSKLYGASWRAAREMGATSMVTYTHLDEPGDSLVAAGWINDGLTDGEWNRPSRPRQMVIDSEKKRRWWAPGSARASQRESSR